MTTSLTSNSAPSRKSSKKSKAGPTVRLPKPSVFTEGLRERCETTVLKTTDEEVNVKTPETSTKPDIFQTPPFLHDDKIIVVRCPPLSKKQEEKDKDAHISDALDALNGTRREALVTPETNRSSNIPITAIEALEKLFGKVPDQKIRGSNYGRLAQDFTFPPKNQSANGSSNAGSSVASSSKNGSESKEDPEEIEKKRRRKSNLNALAKEFTPSSIPGSASTTESDKPTDVLESKEDESKKKRNARKEKTNHEMNGDSENSHQHGRKKRSPETLPHLDNGTHGYDHPFYVHAPPTPFPSAPSGWEEFHSKLTTLTTEVISKVSSEVQKQLELFASEIRTNTNSDDTGGSSTIETAKEKDERVNESTEFEKLQDLFLQELLNYRQEICSTHDELLSRYEKLQTQHLELQAELKAGHRENQGEVQRTSSIQHRHAELQNMHQNLQAQYQQELGQIDELQLRIQQLLSDNAKIQERQQQFHNDITLSQTLQRHIDEIDVDLRELRAKNAQLTSENNKFSDENKALNSSINDMSLRIKKNDSLISDLKDEVFTTKENFRDLQNNNRMLYEENQKLQQKNDVLSSSDNNNKKNISDLNLKLRESQIEIDSLKFKIHDLERNSDDFKNKENSWRSRLQEVEREAGELRAQKIQLEEKRNELEAQKNYQSRELENLNKEVKRLATENSDLDKKCKESHKDLLDTRVSIDVLEQRLKMRDNESNELVQMRNHVKELEKQVTDLENNCLKINELESQLERSKNRNRDLETQLQKSLMDFESHTSMLEQKQKDLDSKRQQENEAQKSESARLLKLCTDLRQENEEFRLRSQELDATKMELQRLQEVSNNSMHNNELELKQARADIIELRSRLHDLEVEKDRLIKENGILRNSAVVANNTYVSHADTPNKELEEHSTYEQYPQQVFGQHHAGHNFMPSLQPHLAATTNSVRFPPVQQAHTQSTHQLTALVPSSPTTTTQGQPILDQHTHGMPHPYQTPINPYKTQSSTPRVKLPQPSNQTSQETQSSNQQREHHQVKVQPPQISLLPQMPPQSRGPAQPQIQSQMPSQQILPQLQEVLPQPPSSQSQIPPQSQMPPDAKHEKNQDPSRNQSRNQSQLNSKQDKGHSRNNSLSANGKKHKKNAGNKRNKSESRGQNPPQTSWNNGELHDTTWWE